MPAMKVKHWHVRLQRAGPTLLLFYTLALFIATTRPETIYAAGNLASLVVSSLTVRASISGISMHEIRLAAAQCFIKKMKQLLVRVYMTNTLAKSISEDDVRLSTMRNDAKRRVYPYKAPEWAKHLKGKPSSKIDLFQKLTPIQRWRLPDIPEDFEIYIKRDDMTGSTLSGHKVRKLEIHFAEALEKDYKTVIGNGADVSTYCRSIAVAGKELGFNVHLVQCSAEEDLPLNGNIFISQMTGAQIHPVPKCDISGLGNKTLELAKNLQRTEGQPAYVLPVRCSGDPGIYAYIDAFHELLLQGVTKDFTDLVVSCGSGITTSAFIIGNYLTGGNLRVHALSTRNNKMQCETVIADTLQQCGFLQQVGDGLDIGDLVSIVEASREPKYGEVCDEHLEFVRETATSTGILLDPVYTGKTANHMVKTIKTSPNSFKGRKILFYNSGSFIGALSKDVLH